MSEPNRGAESTALLREVLALPHLTWVEGLGRLCHGGDVTTHGCPECHCHGSGREHHADSGCKLADLRRRIEAAIGEPPP